MLKIRFTFGLHSLQYKAERLGWSGSLLLQTEAARVSDYGRDQMDCRYVLYIRGPKPPGCGPVPVGGRLASCRRERINTLFYFHYIDSHTREVVLF